VVDRVFFCYVVEALQIVGPAGVRLSHELRCLLAVESFCGCDALRAYSLWSGDQNAQRLHLGADGVRRGVRDDHDLAACSDLLDRVAMKVRTASLGSSGTRACERTVWPPPSGR